MRRIIALVGLLALALPAGASVPGPALGPGPHFATDNVEWLGNIPVNTDSAGARVLDDYLYVTDDRGLTIYDISTPESPERVGFTPVPQGPYFVEEDPDTNGEILLISTYADTLRGTPANFLVVMDVRDKTSPSIQALLPGGQQHTWTCILDCTWAYGNAGLVADLRDPDDPKLSEQNWRSVGVEYSHDVTEVRDGLVVTSSNPVALLDVSQDPESPTILATGQPTRAGGAADRNRFIHGNLWPNEATDRFLLVGGETVGDCSDETSGAFMTFDASEVDLSPEAIAAGEVGEFRQIDEFRVFTGMPTDGNSPYDQYCAHWFTTHPDFRDGGLVAMGWYEHGTRFLDVSAEGTIEEVGWFYPLGGSTSAAYWVNDEVLYAVDYQRGIDILRFTGEPAAEVLRGGDGTHLPIPARPSLKVPSLTTDPYACPLPL